MATFFWIETNQTGSKFRCTVVNKHGNGNLGHTAYFWNLGYPTFPRHLQSGFYVSGLVVARVPFKGNRSNSVHLPVIPADVGL